MRPFFYTSHGTGASPHLDVRRLTYNRFRLLEDLHYVRFNDAGKEVDIRVPAGFETDWASVPYRLRGLVSEKVQCSLASVIHDFIYRTKGVEYDRAQGDALLFEALEVEHVNLYERAKTWTAVTVGGWWAWWKNHRGGADGQK